ncbi:methylated-DNA--[protein]-cysteine S-methyltransferase [Candidatus Nitrospira inopinata]|jgi:O-6-methylguanine DNA methyltransferase|uniref:methylated-DNA--[protein]-cysteine S-methyltransferase n=1 Tax=Candidatus Nitrospira inopinata TaxID=1715989 RepID=A0A0S4KVK5_9BACT|nr:methylated-DNA--[protein]-cysteine S-methyltransferase [Candidatus Nitrospira inopinata]CUQ66436.1 Methylated-DNA-[protein]-cysteine S-methyltransferase [Candidatus Nitrospira inopinata]
MNGINGGGDRRGLVFDSPWGWMGVSETVRGIDMIVLPNRSQRAVAMALGVRVLQGEESARLSAARRQLLDYMSGVGKTFDVPIDCSSGTVFQRLVWRTLRRIPYGTVRSYQWVADRVGGRAYARAVGNAVGANPLPIVIPCHRVVAHDRSLGGFSGGLSMKRKLLALEGSLPLLRTRSSRSGS